MVQSEHKKNEQKRTASATYSESFDHHTSLLSRLTSELVQISEVEGAVVQYLSPSTLVDHVDIMRTQSFGGH